MLELAKVEAGIQFAVDARPQLRLASIRTAARMAMKDFRVAPLLNVTENLFLSPYGGTPNVLNLLPRTLTKRIQYQSKNLKTSSAIRKSL